MAKIVTLAIILLLFQTNQCLAGTYVPSCKRVIEALPLEEIARKKTSHETGVQDQTEYNFVRFKEIDRAYIGDMKIGTYRAYSEFKQRWGRSRNAVLILTVDERSCNVIQSILIRNPTGATSAADNQDSLSAPSTN